MIAKYCSGDYMEKVEWVAHVGSVGDKGVHIGFGDGA